MSVPAVISNDQLVYLTVMARQPRRSPIGQDCGDGGSRAAVGTRWPGFSSDDGHVPRDCPSEKNPYGSDARESPDVHLGTIAHGGRPWFRQMARGMGYAEVVREEAAAIRAGSG